MLIKGMASLLIDITVSEVLIQEWIISLAAKGIIVGLFLFLPVGFFIGNRNLLASIGRSRLHGSFSLNRRFFIGSICIT